MKRPAINPVLCFLPPGAPSQRPESNMDVFDGCGLEGIAKSAIVKKPNRLKNRYTETDAR